MSTHRASPGVSGSRSASPVLGVRVVWSALVLGALALAGCADSAKPAFVAAVEVEKGTRPFEAIPLFEAICTQTPSSTYCPDARARATRLRIKRATGPADAAEVEWLAKDPSLTLAVTALRSSPDRAALLALDVAEKGTSEAEIAPKLAEIEAHVTSAAPRAREWLAQHHNAVLLARIKKACEPDGRGPCADLGRELAETAPTSQEATVAAPLVAARYAATLPLLRKCESALGQRVMLYNRAAIQARCQEMGTEGVGSEGTCSPEQGDPNPAIPTLDFLQKYWDGLIGQLHDTSYVELFQARWKRASETGIVIPRTWPDPPKEPKK